MRRAATVIEVTIASAIGLLLLLGTFELMRFVNRAAFVSGRSLSVAHAAVFLMERVTDDLEAALPERGWLPTAGTTPTFLAGESTHVVGGAGYGSSFSLRRSPPDHDRPGRVTPVAVRYDIDDRAMTVTRLAGTDRQVFEGIEFLVVTRCRPAASPFEAFRVMLCARSTHASTDVQVRALPLTTVVCPRFLRAYQRMPHWVWPAGEWEARVAE